MEYRHYHITRLQYPFILATQHVISKPVIAPPRVKTFTPICFDFRISNFRQLTYGQILTQIYLDVIATLIIER